jgi:hypothetical protein
MAKAFASEADLAAKQITFQRLSPSGWAFTAEGDPNTGVIVGADAVMVIDAQATPLMVVLTHYHAVRVLGASAYRAEHIIASEATRELIRGSFAARTPFPGSRGRRLRSAASCASTWARSKWRSARRGPATPPATRSSGCLPSASFSPAISSNTGQASTPATLEKLRALKPRALVPGRGPALTSPSACGRAIDYTRQFIRGLYACARQGVKQRKSLREVYASAAPHGPHVWPLPDLRALHQAPADLDRPAGPRDVAVDRVRTTRGKNKGSP